MKRRHLHLCVVATLLLFGCSGEDATSPPADGDVLTAEELQRIQESYAVIDAEADAALLSADPEAGLAALLPICRDDPAIEAVWMADDALWVKYLNGGKVCWNVPTPMVPSAESESPGELGAVSSPVLPRRPMEPVGNRRACVINQVSDDEDRAYCLSLVLRQSARLTAAGYEVTIVNGGDANLDFFGEDLDDFAVVFDISHGVFDGSRSWLVTGQVGSDLALGTVHYADWRNDRVTLFNFVERRDGALVGLSLYAISDNFFLDRYEAGALPHSMLYLVACETFEGSTRLAEAFHSRGAAVTIGWDDRNGIGHITGETLFRRLLAGLDLSAAFSTLLPEETHDPVTGADLGFHPDTGGSVHLVEPVTSGTITIDADPDVLAAPWVLTGPAELRWSGNGDRLLEDMLPGNYAISWGEVGGWATPETETRTLAAGGSLLLRGAYDRHSELLLIANDFEDYPLGQPPSYGGPNDPLGLINVQGGSAVISRNTLGLSSQVLLLQRTAGSYANMVWQIDNVTTGTLRVECVVSLNGYGRSFLSHTTDENQISHSIVQVTEDGGIWAGHAGGAERVGTYAPGVPFAIRMDHDLAAADYVVTIDDELNGFQDDAPSSRLTRTNPHVPFLGIGHVILGVTDWSETSLSAAAYDDLGVWLLE